MCFQRQCGWFSCRSNLIVRSKVCFLFLWAVIRVRCACVDVLLMMGWCPVDDGLVFVDTVFEDLSRSFLASYPNVLCLE